MRNTESAKVYFSELTINTCEFSRETKIDGSLIHEIKSTQKNESELGDIYM